MEQRLLLIYCMTLLYRESLLEGQERSTQLCKDINETIKIPETSITLQSLREVTLGLKTTLQWMIEQGNATYNKAQLIQRIRVNTKDETHLYEAFVEGIHPEQTEEQEKASILSYRKTLRNYINTQQVHRIISEAFNSLNFKQDDQFDYLSFVRTVNDKLEPFMQDTVEKRHPSIVDQVNFDELDGVEELLTRSKEELSTEGVLKTGYQGVNRMLGDTGGIRRGEFVVIGALQHNFKSQFMLNVFKHFALYNKPYMRDKTKKPLLVHLSLENELPMNMLWLYANLKENETGEAFDFSHIDPLKAAAYIKERLSVNGYNVEMLRLEPNQCSIHDLHNLVMDYESKGYEIHAIVCDYLNMMNKRGLTSSSIAGEDIRELFRRTRNLTSCRGISFITAHQLSTEAKHLVRQKIDDFVKEIANKGYYDGSKRIDQEVDLELYLHIVKIPGKGSYLTIQRGKHRTVRITKDSDLFCVLPFKNVGGVLDDLHTKDTSMKTVGAKRDENGVVDWFD